MFTGIAKYDLNLTEANPVSLATYLGFHNKRDKNRNKEKLYATKKTTINMWDDHFTRINLMAVQAPPVNKDHRIIESAVLTTERVLPGNAMCREFGDVTYFGA